jgi:trehalose/maltose transport system substrate-binding protein
MGRPFASSVAAIAAIGIVLGTASCGGGSSTESQSAQTGAERSEASKEAVHGTYKLNQPPPVPEPEKARQFKGQTITFYGENLGIGVDSDKELAKRFEQDTGVKVKVVPIAASVTDAYANYTRLLSAKSGSIDAMTIDVIWPGAFAPFLVDLGPELQADADAMTPALVENDTVDGKLVAIPWNEQHGLLYYRKDLLEKYGYTEPPKTWDDLTAYAKKIQDGERKSNPEFSGFVWQGAGYEGLTCDALEWLSSSGAGTFADSSGQVTIDSPEAVKALNRARDWIGTISPRDVTTFKEEEARNVFQAGNAAFMRNWVYAYELAKAEDSPIRDKFEVAPLPADPGQDPAAALGGGQLGVNKYSKHVGAAIEWVRYLSSEETQKYRAMIAGTVPVRTTLLKDPEVLKLYPFLKLDLQPVARPSTQFKANYNEASTVVFQAVSRVLGGADAASVLPDAKARLQKLVGE